jgi:predicted RND superfamily exporter protein
MVKNSVLGIIKYRWLVLFLSLCAVGGAALGLQHLEVVTDYQVFFDGDNERLMAARNNENSFGRRDTVQFILSVKSGTIFQPEVLSVVEALTEASWQIPFSRRVDSLTNFPYTRAEGDDFFVDDLFSDSESMSASEFDTRRKFALNEPSLVSAINQKQNFTGVLVAINLPEHNSAATQDISKYVLEMTDRFKADYPDVNIDVSGSILLNNTFFKASTSGTAKLLLVMFALMLVAVGVLLRSVVVTIAILLLTVLSILSGVGLATWMGIPLTGPSSSAPIIISALAVANTVHIMAILLKKMIEGETKFEAIVLTVKVNFQPVVLTSLTTIIGFLCLNTSDVPPYRFLGTTAALGVASSLFLTFTFLPALLSIMTIRVKKQSTKVVSRPDYWRLFADFVIERRKVVFLFSVVVALLVSPLALNNKVDDRLLRYFDEEVPIRANSEVAMKNIAPFYALSYGISAIDDGGIAEPEYLRHLEIFSEWIRAQPEVMYLSTLTDIMKRINRSMHGDDDHWYKIPEDRNLASQYLLLYELSLPYGQDLTNQIDITKSSTKVLVGFRDISSSEMKAFGIRSEAWMADNLPDYMQAPATGPPLLFAYIWESATKSNLMGMVMAVLLISIVIAIAMKSIKLGLISLIPNLIPAAMAFGVWSLINGQLDIGSSIVAVISFGIIVDDTIHFLSKYQYAKNNGSSAEDAVRFAFTTVGRALLVTTLALVIGFSVLTTSSFTLNSSMGLLTSIAISFALVLDFLLLPPLLIFMDRGLARKRSTNPMLLNVNIRLANQPLQP